MKKHYIKVHVKQDRKTIKHIKKDGKVVCPVCAKEYTSSHNLKLHIIKTHN